MSSCQVLRQSRYQAHVDLQMVNIMGFIRYLAVGEIAHGAFLTGLGWPGLVRLGPYRRCLGSSFFPAVRRRTPRASCSPAGAVCGGVVLFAQALTRDPYRLDAIVRLGIARDKLGAPDEAIDVLERARERAPGEIAVRLFLGLAYLRKNEPGKGRRAPHPVRQPRARSPARGAGRAHNQGGALGVALREMRTFAFEAGGSRGADAPGVAPPPVTSDAC